MTRTTSSKRTEADKKGVHGLRRGEGRPSPTEATQSAPATTTARKPGSTQLPQLNPKARTPGSNPRPAGGKGREPSGSQDTGTDLIHWLKEWRAKFFVGAATVLTGAMGIWLASWLGFFAGPQPPAASAPPPIKPIKDPGHLPGRQDVSTMAHGHRFYAVPNFYFFQSCGRPCWLPLYQLPTEQSAFVTDGWPCEYYGPNRSSTPSCTLPPPRRKPSELADSADKNSGDRLLVLCQTTHLGRDGTAATIHNQVTQGSNIWDMVAVPKSYISRDSPAAGHLTEVSAMQGFYQAFGPDMWFGNTGWHGIPCK